MDQIPVPTSANIKMQNVCTQKNSVSPLLRLKTNWSVTPKTCDAIQNVTGRIGHKRPKPRKEIVGIRKRLPEICVARQKRPKYKNEKRKATRKRGLQYGTGRSVCSAVSSTAFGPFFVEFCAFAPLC